MTHEWHDVYRHAHIPAHHLDPRSKILTGLAFIGMVLFTPHMNRWQAVGYAAIVLLLMILAGSLWKAMARRLVSLLPFALLMLLSAVMSKLSLSHLYQSVAKALLSMAALSLAALATPFPDVLRALEECRVPKIFVLLLAFVYRYVAVLGKEVVRVERGWKARYFGRRPFLQIAQLGHVLATLIIRSYERAERVYAAMLARGFSQASTHSHVLHFGQRDLLFTALFLMALSGVRWGLA